MSYTNLSLDVGCRPQALPSVGGLTDNHRTRSGELESE